MQSALSKYYFPTLSVIKIGFAVQTVKVRKGWVSFSQMQELQRKTARKIPLMYSFSGNNVASAPISTFMCLWAIYIVPGSVYIFPPAE
jgi:hypothetical protein